jgi:hypothetical protein
MSIKPTKASDVVVVDMLGGAVAYQRSHTRFLSLSAPVAVTLHLCDGDHSLEDIARHLARETGLPEDPEWVRLSVRRLQRYRLIEGADGPLPPTLKRREAIHLLRRLGLALALLPVVTLVDAPSAADAGSLLGSNSNCLDSAQCRSGICLGGKCV